MVFYIRFDHNVAQRDGGGNVADPNCSLISVVSNGGKPVVRSVDSAEELGFKKSSVSVAMKNLREPA